MLIYSLTCFEINNLIKIAYYIENHCQQYTTRIRVYIHR